MDKIVKYRTLLKSILTEYDRLASNPPTPGVESLLAFDEDRDQYLWFQVGWTQNERIRGITVHIQIKEGKVWIEQDWTENGITTDLLNAGVPHSDIVLAFHPPEVRSLTDFAVA